MMTQEKSRRRPKRQITCGNIKCKTINTPLWRKGWTDMATRKSVMLCNACGIHFKKGHYCLYCNQIYRESEGDDRTNPWIGCDKCSRWVHQKCVLAHGEICNAKLPYLCLRCKDDTNSGLPQITKNNDLKREEKIPLPLQGRLELTPLDNTNTTACCATITPSVCISVDVSCESLREELKKPVKKRKYKLMVHLNSLKEQAGTNNDNELYYRYKKPKVEHYWEEFDNNRSFGRFTAAQTCASAWRPMLPSY